MTQIGTDGEGSLGSGGFLTTEYTEDTEAEALGVDHRWHGFSQMGKEEEV